jgi:hypothetical protein
MASYLSKKKKSIRQVIHIVFISKLISFVTSFGAPLFFPVVFSGLLVETKINVAQMV